MGKIDMGGIKEMFKIININSEQTIEKLDKLIQELNQDERDNAELMKQFADQSVQIETTEREMGGKNLVIKIIGGKKIKMIKEEASEEDSSS